MEFQIWIACKERCHKPEGDRAIFETKDPIEAITKASLFRDLNHETWIKVLESA